MRTPFLEDQKKIKKKLKSSNMLSVARYTEKQNFYDCFLRKTRILGEKSLSLPVVNHSSNFSVCYGATTEQKWSAPSTFVA